MKHEEFNINPYGRDFFLGDLHGEITQFMDALARVDFDFDKDRVFCVGDLIDRGEDSEACLKLLLKPWFFCIQGNHEDMMLGGQPYHIWMQNGGEWWNDIHPEDQEYYLDLAVDMLYDRITVNTLWGPIGVIHADIFGDWNDFREQVDWTGEPAGIWGRNRYYAKNCEPVRGVKAVVAGHTPVNEITVLGNVVYIDTGAVFDNKLTLIEAEDVLNRVGATKRAI